MTRPLRLETPGGIHHVMSRGINRQVIFRTPTDYAAFLLDLQACATRFGWHCLAHCLMPNHFHLLLQTPWPNLGLGMRDLKGGYASAFNRRHGESGPRFEGRYRSQLVQEGDYAMAVARYIALNPVRAGLTLLPEAYEWSSFRSMQGGQPLKPVDNRRLLNLLNLTREAFVELVRDGAGLPLISPTSPICGDAAFVEHHAPGEPPRQPVERAAFDQARPPLSSIIETLPRDEAIREARSTHHFTIKEIAAALGCSTETVRRRLRMWDVRT